MLVSKILYLVFPCCAGLNHTEGNLTLWITYNILPCKKPWSAHRNPGSLLANTTCRVLVAAQSKGRWEVFTLPKYRAQKKKSFCEEARVLNSDNFDMLLLVRLYCRDKGEIRWLHYSFFSQKSLMHPHMDIHWFMHVAHEPTFNCLARSCHTFGWKLVPSYLRMSAEMKNSVCEVTSDHSTIKLLSQTFSSICICIYPSTL